jgi:hypothetical protein
VLRYLLPSFKVEPVNALQIERKPGYHHEKQPRIANFSTNVPAT